MMNFINNIKLEVKILYSNLSLEILQGFIKRLPSSGCIRSRILVYFSFTFKKTAHLCHKFDGGAPTMRPDILQVPAKKSPEGGQNKDNVLLVHPITPISTWESILQ
jgi:hypothetical protein